MAQTQTIARHYARIIQQWPHDPLRPTVSFTKLLEKRAAKAAAKPGTVTEQQAELRNVNALYSLLDDRYTKKYPVSSAVLRPTSDPDYYDRLIAELHEAPRRSWFGRFINRWKGFLRFK
ncbi:hypothetical protein LTS18_002645 [Coniosporium uncinatum]|uniref:Uncharacterized protein n=1 Tax=Coniosporium uncinatum TaxID=93489 RepID=A0ACC3DYI0_9PEZI|nr:hypothetical protein LTS18_002645 [Coniosporium uncinatum]